MIRPHALGGSNPHLSRRDLTSDIRSPASTRPLSSPHSPTNPTTHSTRSHDDILKNFIIAHQPMERTPDAERAEKLGSEAKFPHREQFA